MKDEMATITGARRPAANLREGDEERNFDRRPGQRVNPGWVQLALSLPLLAFIAIPILALFFRVEPASILESLRTPQARQAIVLSLWTSAVCTLLAIVLGTPVGLLLARRNLRFGRLIDTLVDLPILIPPSVAGIALLMAFGRRGVIGAALNDLGIQMAFTPAAVILAQLFVSAPFFVKAASLGFAGVDEETREAAAMDGANQWRQFWRILVPLSWPALLTGAVTTWARALGEFGATIIFAGNFPGRTQTMPLAIYLGFEMNLDVALTLAVIMIGLAALSLLAVKLVKR